MYLFMFDINLYNPILLFIYSIVMLISKQDMRRHTNPPPPRLRSE